MLPSNASAPAWGPARHLVVSRLDLGRTLVFRARRRVIDDADRLTSRSVFWLRGRRRLPSGPDR